ncbi:chloramphenicol phosphotransferase CPT family protein [Roseobacteraceae bacterium NS-SX3]
MARIIFLHGASSSGKSTLAAAIRSLSGQPWIHFSIDHLRDSGAWIPRDGPDWPARRAAFFDGFHQAAAGFAAAGNDMILEHILDTPGWHRQLQGLLAGHRLLFAALHAPDAVLTTREERRGNRPAGSGVRDAATVHRGLRYDLELDACLPPQKNAAKVLARLEAHPGFSAFFES